MDTQVNEEAILEALRRQNSTAERIIIPARSMEVVRRELIDYVKEQMEHRQVFATSPEPEIPERMDETAASDSPQLPERMDETAASDTPQLPERMDETAASDTPQLPERTDEPKASDTPQLPERMDETAASDTPQLPERTDETEASHVPQQNFTIHHGEGQGNDGKADEVIDISDDDDEKEIHREFGRLLRDAGVVNRAAMGEKVVVERRVATRPDQAQRVCTVRVIEHQPGEPKVVWYCFEQSSRRVYAHWDWPKDEGLADYAIVTIDRFAVELSPEMNRLPKEERHYKEAKLKYLSSQREVIEPRRSFDPRRKIEKSDEYTPHTVRIEVVPGDYYTITVELYQGRMRYSYKFLKETRIVFNRREVELLHDLAKSFIANQCGINSDYPFEKLFRCKPRIYFNSAQTRHGGKMLPYLKDQNGHAACVINGRLEGLFFSVNVNDEIDSSPFGEVLFEIKAHKLLNRKEHRIYFADFYCNSGVEGGKFDSSGYVAPHYITLVACKRDSPSDKFCAEHNLLEVDITKPESILRVRSDSRGPRYSINGRNPLVWVEIFYTEPVDFEQGEDWKTLPVIGTGRSRQGGIKRVPNCDHCDNY